jgi:predicted TIM-barrel fold metal-dependent hydrolase
VSLGHLILSGTFERHPALRVGSVEHDLGWVPYFLDRLDYTYAQGYRRAGQIRYRDGALPRHFFQRNVFVSFQEDAMGIRERAAIGVDTLMWGSDYPHTESTFPRSREIVDRQLRGVPADERASITHRNVARLYEFDLG